MHLSPNDDPMSIFVDGKLKPGTYKVQNLASDTYLEVLEPSKELCCRPAAVLTPNDALVIWNKPLTLKQTKLLKILSGNSKRRARGIISKR